MTTSTCLNPGNCCPSQSGINVTPSLSRFWAFLKYRNKQYRDLRHLAEMTDRELRDIGLQRSEIRAAVYQRNPDQARNETMARR
jgi:uncharacterized protein YjiS (DUF1127 family)